MVGGEGNIFELVDADSDPPPTTKKLPRPPKPVKMRPAYKRYPIATSPSVLVIHLKRFQQIAKTHLFMDWRRGGRIGLIMKMTGRGGRGRRGVCIGCMLLWFTLGIWCVSFRLFFLFLGLMVYYRLEAITLRTLRSLLNHPVGHQWIHRDGQSLILWGAVRLRNKHKASWATNGKAVGVY